MAILGIIIVVFILLCFIIGGAQKIDNENHLQNLNEIKEFLKNKNFKILKSIEYSNMLSNLPTIQLNIDMEHKKIAFCKVFPYQKIDIFNFADIIECEIIEDSNIIMKGGIGRAVVGSVVAGGVGAIVGANTRNSKNVVNTLQIRIVTRNISNSLYIIDLITTETQKESTTYKNSMSFANNVYATISSIINSNNIKEDKEVWQEKDISQNNNFIEQLERLSKLKNEGIITEKEFEESKKIILKSEDNVNT